MCYGCKITCDDCKPKFVYCPDCGQRNMLVMPKCLNCGRPISEEEKEAARQAWKLKKMGE